MAAIQTEVYSSLQPWQRPLHIYGGLVCNSLMADSWSDRSPLHEAAYHGRLLHLRTLLAQGFHVNTLTMDAVSPLHEACLGGHSACAKYLLDHGADVHQVATGGTTPLFNSCSSGSAACVRLILQNGASVHGVHQLASPIHEVAKKDYSECLELLLAYQADIDMELPTMGTPLYSACMASATTCVHMLLLSGADVELGCGRDRPLHAAVRGGRATVVDLLLDFGANQCCRNAEGKTPLGVAAPNSTVRAILQNRGPCSLSQLCRCCIRRSLGSSRLHRASSLVLPHAIQGFLLYQ
uniref:ankyrin repeat and SOCS box protein 11 n=1 Tax=Doryrhamphus excisus TaxID=161450 RepID=UPI0025ADBF7F|nr:ankyrin repeat and SOCS box protein 11 [Doryrhamphus excisus]